MPAAHTRGRVAEMLAIAGLSGFEDRRVTAISGGQQQRVALARALAPDPRVLLLDEPLSNLDPSLREKTRRELKRAIRKVGITTIFVTHEQEEAFELGDRVAVLHRGRLEQLGTPEELFEQPATRFVATFVGRSNVLPVVWDGERARCRTGPVVARHRRRAADIGLRGAISSCGRRGSPSRRAPGSHALEGTVVERRFAGRSAYFLVATAAVRRDRGARASRRRRGKATASTSFRRRAARRRACFRGSREARGPAAWPRRS